MENDERVTIVDEQSGMVPPTWWRGDAAAADSAMRATMELKRVIR